MLPKATGEVRFITRNIVRGLLAVFSLSLVMMLSAGPGWAQEPVAPQVLLQQALPAGVTLQTATPEQIVAAVTAAIQAAPDQAAAIVSAAILAAPDQAAAIVSAAIRVAPDQAAAITAAAATVAAVQAAQDRAGVVGEAPRPAREDVPSPVLP